MHAATKSPHAAVKIPCAATKTRCSQINKLNIFLKKEERKKKKTSLSGAFNKRGNLINNMLSVFEGSRYKQKTILFKIYKHVPFLHREKKLKGHS